MAYQKGKSIRDNALAHAHNRYLLKTDLEDFLIQLPQISSGNVLSCLLLVFNCFNPKIDAM